MIHIDGKYSRYYLHDTDSKEKNTISILRQPILRKIILFILNNPQSSHKKICEYIKLAPSTTSFHLKKIVTYGLLIKNINGKESLFKIKDPQFIIDLIVRYKKTFLDNSVDNFLDNYKKDKFKDYKCVKKFSYYKRRAVFVGVPEEKVLKWATEMPEDGIKVIRSFLLEKK